MEPNPEQTSAKPKSKKWIWIWAGCGCAVLAFVALGVIATIAVPSLLGRFGEAQRRKARIDINSLEQAILTYALENGGRYPDSLEVLVTPDQNNNVFLKGYTQVPLDPWKNPYHYTPPSSGRSFRVFSYGKDGAPGGEGADADIENESSATAK